MLHCFQRVLILKLWKGECTFRYSKCGQVMIVCWRDNKNVIVLCTDPRFSREITTVIRRDRMFLSEPNRQKEVPQPYIINRYIKWM